MAQIDRLSDVFHKRWTVPILQSLWENKGSKYVTLIKALGGSPGAIRATLKDLLRRDWVMKNPGYGHPMRPEYVLTGKGALVASRCHFLMGALEDARLSEAHRSKWAVSVLYCVGEQEQRFSKIKTRLTLVTDRSLVLCLKALCKSGAVERRVEDTFPPSVVYSISRRAKGIHKHISALLSVL